MHFVPQTALCHNKEVDQYKFLCIFKISEDYLKRILPHREVINLIPLCQKKILGEHELDHTTGNRILLRIIHPQIIVLHKKLIAIADLPHNIGIEFFFLFAGTSPQEIKQEAGQRQKRNDRYPRNPVRRTLITVDQRNDRHHGRHLDQIIPDCAVRPDLQGKPHYKHDLYQNK